MTDLTNTELFVFMTQNLRIAGPWVEHVTENQRVKEMYARWTPWGRRICLAYGPIRSVFADQPDSPHYRGEWKWCARFERDVGQGVFDIVPWDHFPELPSLEGAKQAIDKALLEARWKLV